MTDNRLAACIDDETRKHAEKQALQRVEGGGGAPTPLAHPAGLYLLVDMATAGYPSEHTRRMYRARLLEWLGSVEVEQWGVTRESASRYIARVREEGKGYDLVRQLKAAMNVFVDEAEVRGLIDRVEAHAIKAIMLKGRGRGRPKKGRWLGESEVKELVGVVGGRVGGKLDSVNTTTGTIATTYEDLMERARDGALLAMLLGCGLRRSEAVRVRWEQYRELEGRMVLVDVFGKGGKVDTLPVPDWGVELLDEWERVGRVGMGRGEGDLVLCSLREESANSKRKHAKDKPLSAEWVRGRVRRMVERAQQAGSKLEGKVNPHDFRRTLAKLMRAAGVDLEQVQEMLRHDSVVTTERYLGGKLEMGKGKAGVDRVWDGTRAQPID